MAVDNAQERAFLYQLYTRTGADTDTTASMYEVGDAMGLDKDESGTLAQSLFMQGAAELKTLSGGMAITLEGLKELDITPAPPANEETVSLGTGPVLETANREVVETVTNRIKKILPGSAQDYADLEALIIDLKTLEVQMLSPTPKTGILKEIFKSIHRNLASSGTDPSSELDTALRQLTES